mmetsp:Transcript_106251/g.310628  ORF Transcript_106251/g.310628 Transcript_106251/m.310628 type:complete len:374 (-) Transcript_106251:748-1869(-)
MAGPCAWTVANFWAAGFGRLAPLRVGSDSQRCIEGVGAAATARDLLAFRFGKGLVPPFGRKAAPTLSKRPGLEDCLPGESPAGAALRWLAGCAFCEGGASWLAATIFAGDLWAKALFRNSRCLDSSSAAPRHEALALMLSLLIGGVTGVRARETGDRGELSSLSTSLGSGAATCGAGGRDEAFALAVGDGSGVGPLLPPGGSEGFGCPGGSDGTGGALPAGNCSPPASAPSARRVGDPLSCGALACAAGTAEEAAPSVQVLAAVAPSSTLPGAAATTLGYSARSFAMALCTASSLDCSSVNSTWPGDSAGPTLATTRSVASRRGMAARMVAGRSWSSWPRLRQPARTRAPTATASALACARGMTSPSHGRLSS